MEDAGTDDFGGKEETGCDDFTGGALDFGGGGGADDLGGGGTTLDFGGGGVTDLGGGGGGTDLGGGGGATDFGGGFVGGGLTGGGFVFPARPTSALLSCIYLFETRRKILNSLLINHLNWNCEHFGRGQKTCKHYGSRVDAHDDDLEWMG